MNSNLSVVILVSGIMMLNLVKSFQGERSINFSAENFDSIVKSPLEIATYFCLAIYLFQCGYNFNKDSDLRGRRKNIPTSLLFAMFGVGSAPFYLKKSKPNMQDKIIGSSALYGLFILGSKLGQKSIPISELQ